MRTFRKSAGTLCTAPGEIAFLVMDFILHRYVISLGSLGRCPNWAAEKPNLDKRRKRFAIRTRQLAFSRRSCETLAELLVQEIYFSGS